MIVCQLSNVLKVTGLPQDIIKILRKFCTFQIFTKLPNGKVKPETLVLFSQTGNSITIPRGCFWAIQDYATSYNIPFILNYDTCVGEKLNLEVNKEFNYTSGKYGYQADIVNQLQEFHTIRLKAPTASGKTSIACIHAFKEGKGPILFLADQETLIEQFILTAMKIFSLPREEIGIIKADKRSIKPITVGSLQTLGREGFDLKNIRKTFYTVYFDESHISSATSYRKVLLNLAPKNLIGLSATPDHYSSKNLSNLMESLLGPVGVEIAPENLEGRLIPEIISKLTYRNFEYKAGPDCLSGVKRACINKLHKLMMLDEVRNDLICSDTNNLVRKGHVILITVQRVSHGEILKNKLEKLYGIPVALPYIKKIKIIEKKVKGKLKEVEEENTSVDKKQLKNDLIDIKDGNIKVLIGTYKLFTKGFDCPSLSAIQYVGAFDGVNSTTVIQSVGRIQRHLEGKNKALVINYCDNSSPYDILGDWSKARIKCLKENFEK